MLYNFLRGDLGFLPVLRQLLHGDERVTERGRRKAGPASKVWFREDRAKGPSSRTLALSSLSLASICNPFICESPGNSFGPTYAAAAGLPRSPGRFFGRCACAAQTDTRLVSINHRRSDSAAEEKSPPNGADGRTDADERALGGAGGGLGVQWGRPFQDAPGQSAKSLEKLAKRNALSGRTRTDAPTDEASDGSKERLLSLPGPFSVPF